MAEKAGREAVRLVVPLDASAIEGFEPDKPIRVLAVDAADQPLAESQVAKFDAKGQAVVTFKLVRRAGSVRVVVGPGEATDEELAGLQTLSVDIPGRRWGGQLELKLPPLKIPPFHWYWWLTWCRWFTIRGRLVCPDGSPVPGATVCAYDVDAWWWWWSKQQVGCVVTDVNGAFEIKFRWCCGWWPWWWWRRRFWQLHEPLVDRILTGLRSARPGSVLPVPSPEPSFRMLEGLLGSVRGGNTDLTSFGSAPGSIADRPIASLPDRTIPTIIDQLGEQLRAVLPRIPELDSLRLWPWWPWWPWGDCTPDIVFRATQPCPGAASNVVLNESFFQARWNIPTTLNGVTLVANQNACCVSPSGCHEDDCLDFTQVCGVLVNNVGGNMAALPAPVGYANPTLISNDGDRPFAGAITVSGTAECMTGVDYYEIERSSDGIVYAPIAPDEAGAFTRTYLDLAAISFSPITFSAGVPISGHHVYETLEHYEATHPPADWGSNRLWVQYRDVLFSWLTKGNVADGAHHLRVVGWNLVAGVLVNPRVLDLCGPSPAPNHLVLRVDNQVTYPPAAAPPGNPCGPGTVHLCTDEPMTDIVAVSLVHAGGGGATTVSACGEYRLRPGDTLRVDFIAYDPDKHLRHYDLKATYDENLSVPLLSLAGASLTGIALGGVPAAPQVGPGYAAARLAGAAAPHWPGGGLRLEVPAALAFPKTCCYQLELRARKRTIVDCSGNPHENLSEYSFMVAV
jgi:hypothetical protein